MRIKTEIPYEIIGDTCSVFFNNLPEEVINGLQKIIENCKSAGYSNIKIQWSSYGNPYPTFYGEREETKEEITHRIETEEIKKQKEAAKVAKEVKKAKKTLEKYGGKVLK